MVSRGHARLPLVFLPFLVFVSVFRFVFCVAITVGLSGDLVTLLPDFRLLASDIDFLAVLGWLT